MKNLAQRLRKTFVNNEVTKRILITILIIVIYRLLASIPLPGIDIKVYKENFGQNTASEISYFFTLFTGGRVDAPSIVGLGLAAYINASIIMQLLPYSIPRLKRLQEDGERGRQAINQITRFLTVPLSLLTSVGYILLLSQRDLLNINNDASIAADPNHIPAYLIDHAAGSNWPSISKIIFMALVLMAGTIFLMWLSEYITEKGLGNGSSVIIVVGIMASLPSIVERDFANVNLTAVFSEVLKGNFSVLNSTNITTLLLVIVGLVLFIFGVVLVNESVRKVPIQYARRVRGGEIGKGSNLPIKFTLTGVLPVIFATSLLTIPQLIVPLIKNINGVSADVVSFMNRIQNSFLYANMDNKIDAGDVKYSILYFLLIVVFGVFYAFIILNPKDQAENLQKSGGFIPGVRPGKGTERYITDVLLKITIIGSLLLGLIALIPVIARDLIIINNSTGVQLLSGIGGTTILIVVGVFLDTMRQYRSLRATKNYEKYATY